MYALRRRLAFLVVFTVGVLALASAAHANGNHSNHHGNSGTVKVDDDDVDDGNANHPHVICALRVVITRSFGAPLKIVFDAVEPTTRSQGSQELLVVTLPKGDDVTKLLDLSGVVGGIVAHPQQGFHVRVSVLLPGGGVKQKVIWILKDCPPDATTTTTAAPTTSTTAKVTTSTTSATVVGGATTNTTVPTNVLGEQFSKPAANTAAGAGAAQLANTGSPISPGLAGLLVIGGLGLGVAARAAGGRRLEATLRAGAAKEPGRPPQL